MRIARVALRSLNDELWCRYLRPTAARTLSTNAFSGQGTRNGQQGFDSYEPGDDFMQRIFGGSSGGNSRSDAFFQKLDRVEKSRGSYSSSRGGERNSEMLDGLDDSFNTLSDGMDGKLKKAATYFEFDIDEIEKEDYAFRPDVSFDNQSTYETKDLDLTKPGVRRAYDYTQFEVTTEEVLKKADFRNVRFLANFITEAGIIIKRSKTGISAKAQRKVAREIKTARAFGLMPFTTMGTKSFVFGNTMEDQHKDFEYESYDAQLEADAKGRDAI